MEDRVLKTTSKIFAGIITAIGLLPTYGWGNVQSALPMLLGAASLGDDGRSSVAQADELLREARAAMAEGNFEIADSKISRAEALQPKYPMFHVGDNPKRARGDLDKLMVSKAVGTNGKKVVGKSPSPQAKDPFLADATGKPETPLKTESAQPSNSGTPGANNLADRKSTRLNSSH